MDSFRERHTNESALFSLGNTALHTLLDRSAHHEPRMLEGGEARSIARY